MPSTAANPADALAALQRLLLAIDTAAMAETITKHQAAILRAMVGSCDYATGETRLPLSGIASRSGFQINATSAFINELLDKGILVTTAEAIGRQPAARRIDIAKLELSGAAGNFAGNMNPSVDPHAEGGKPARPPRGGGLNAVDPHAEGVKAQATADLTMPPAVDPLPEGGKGRRPPPGGGLALASSSSSSSSSPPKPPPPAERKLFELAIEGFGKQATASARFNASRTNADRLHAAASKCTACGAEEAVRRACMEAHRAKPDGFGHLSGFIAYVCTILENWSLNGVPDDDSYTGGTLRGTLQGSTGTGSAAAQRPRARTASRPASPSLAAAIGGSAAGLPIKRLGPKPPGA